VELNGTIIEDEHAEAFGMWATRLVVTASDEYWVRMACDQACGYGTSVIGCDTEAGVECLLEPGETPDGRPGAALLFFAFNSKALAKAVANRAGQCLMTCPTTAVHDGLSDATEADGDARFELGKWLSCFGDGYQQSTESGGRPYWRVPVMDGEFLVVESVGAVKATGGGNFLICGTDQSASLDAARRAVDAIRPIRQVVTPFPGGVVRCGSKVGSQRYKSLTASTNEAYCPTLKGQVESRLRDGVTCVYEIVIDGLSVEAISVAMKAGITAACGPGIVAISAGNYQGRLGKRRLRLHDVMGQSGPGS